MAKLLRTNYLLVLRDISCALTPFPVLSACGEYGIGLFATGETHHPNGVFLPYLQHSRATRWLRKQLAASRPLAKQTWAAIVRQKIANQGHCLDLAGVEGGERLAAFVRQVRSGDSTLMESQAAAFYFSRLFGARFRRSQLTWTNAALNYGYAILRGAIARGLVAHGFFPSLGLHHASEQNAFNLADDLIEPFRPVVDLYVATHADDDRRDLTPGHKAELVSLLNVDMCMPRGKMSALAAIEQGSESLARVLEQGSEKHLELPELIGLEQHVAES